MFERLEVQTPRWFKTTPKAPKLRYASGWQRLVVGGFLLALAVVLWAALIGLWPAVTSATDDKTTQTAKSIPLVFGLWRPKVSNDTALFVLVIVASLVGSLVHVASSFAAHCAHRDFKVSWLWWYSMRFVVGTGLGLLLYVALRGGLFSGDFTTKQVNPYGIAAVAGLTGMFSKQATDKLAQLFDVAFAVRARCAGPGDRRPGSCSVAGGSQRHARQGHRHRVRARRHRDRRRNQARHLLRQRHAGGHPGARHAARRGWNAQDPRGQPGPDGQHQCRRSTCPLPHPEA